MTIDQRLDVVFEGGGARGLALNGAVAELERRGHTLGRLVGTSAGAITATLAAAGYSGEELRSVSVERLASGASRMTEFLGVPHEFSDEELSASTLGQVLRAAEVPIVPDALEHRAELFGMHTLLRLAPFAQLFSFVERGGLYSADGFLAWLRERLDARGRDLSGTTLAQMHQRTGRDLTLVASDTTARQLVVMNHRTAPDLPVMFAVRMSMSIPFLWPEVVWQSAWGTYRGRSLAGHAMMDGGLVSNFALRFLVSDEPWIEEIMGGAPDPECGVLGFTLDSTLAVSGGGEPAKVVNVHSKTIDRIERVFETALGGNDGTEQAVYEPLVCALPTGGYGTLEFGMSVDRIETLMNVAAKSLDGWLAERGERPPRIAHARAMLAATGRLSAAPPLVAA